MINLTEIFMQCCRILFHEKKKNKCEYVRVSFTVPLIEHYLVFVCFFCHIILLAEQLYSMYSPWKEWFICDGRIMHEKITSITREPWNSYTKHFHVFCKMRHVKHWSPAPLATDYIVPVTEYVGAFRIFWSGKQLNPNWWASSSRPEWTDSNKERRGGKQSYADTSGLPRKTKVLKYTKETTESRTEQIIKLPQKKQHMLFSN